MAIAKRRARSKQHASRSPLAAPATEGMDEPFALVDRVYEEIREAIREGAIKPGYRLVERDIAARLDVSRTPVREALRLLEAHGLAASVSGRGLVVRTLTSGEIAELYFAWEAIEGLAAATAAQNATELEIEALQQIQAQWKVDDTPRNLGRLNKHFHFAIHTATHNRFLMRSARTIDDSVSLLGFSTYSLPNRGGEVAAEHGAIIKAIAARDPKAAEAAARAHIRRAGQLRMAADAHTGPDAPGRRQTGASHIDWR